MNMTIKTVSKFLFLQVRESPTPLNIPTPTLAPDQGGPVACSDKNE